MQISFWSLRLGGCVSIRVNISLCVALPKRRFEQKQVEASSISMPRDSEKAQSSICGRYHEASDSEDEMFHRMLVSKEEIHQ